MAKDKDRNYAAPAEPDGPVLPEVTGGVAVLENFEVPKPETKRYWVGVKKGCPFQNLSVGGIEFSLFTDEVGDDLTTGETTRARRPGRLVDLTDEVVAYVKKAMESHVIRMEGARPRKLDKKSDKYKPSIADVPYARFLYLQPVTDLGREGETPKPIAQ